VNDSGQLGNGKMGGFFAPSPVTGITTAVQVAAGGEHSCAVLQNGTVECWGANGSGQLGDGTNTPSAAPVVVSGITTATQLAAGDNHTCALLQGGTVACWGDDFEGELGNGRAGPGQNSSVPVAAEISPKLPATEISAGGANTCAVMQSRRVTCWGNGDHGQLGVGMIVSGDASPALVSGITNATGVSTGEIHSCAVREDGGVSCWGPQWPTRRHDSHRPNGRRCARARRRARRLRRNPGQRRDRQLVRNTRKRHRGLLGIRAARRRRRTDPCARDRPARKLARLDHHVVLLLITSAEPAQPPAAQQVRRRPLFAQRTVTENRR
jgi:alpha-tubulin suppressor-like RCC1 family protein